MVLKNNASLIYQIVNIKKKFPTIKQYSIIYILPFNECLNPLDACAVINLDLFSKIVLLSVFTAS